MRTRTSRKAALAAKKGSTAIIGKKRYRVDGNCENQNVILATKRSRVTRNRPMIRVVPQSQSQRATQCAPEPEAVATDDSDSSEDNVRRPRRAVLRGQSRKSPRSRFTGNEKAANGDDSDGFHEQSDSSGEQNSKEKSDLNWTCDEDDSNGDEYGRKDGSESGVENARELNENNGSNRENLKRKTKHSDIESTSSMDVVPSLTQFVQGDDYTQEGTEHEVNPRVASCGVDSGSVHGDSDSSSRGNGQDCGFAGDDLGRSGDALQSRIRCVKSGSDVEHNSMGSSPSHSATPSGDVVGGEEAIDSPVWKELDFDIMTINQKDAKSRLEAELSERPESRSRLLVTASRRGRRRSARVLESRDMGCQAIRKSWIADLTKLKKSRPTFFVSKEARLENLTRVSQGKAAYEALPINEFNNCDMQMIYNVEYSSKVRTGGSLGSYKQLLTVAGQYVRMAIMAGRCKVFDLYEAGNTLRTVCDLTLVDMFFNFYAAKGQGSTVMTKALHIAKLAKHAKVWFHGKNDDLESEAERVQMNARSTLSSYKQEARRRASQKREIECRLLDGKYMDASDFSVCIQQIRHQMNGIMHKFQKLSRDRGAINAEANFKRRPKLLNKWCTNLLLVLLLTAGGQRPQVYTQLQLPSQSDLVEMRAMIERCKCFELRTLREKTVRSLSMPHVIVMGGVLTYLEFHLEVIRPLVVQNLLSEREKRIEDGDEVLLVPDGEVAVLWEAQPLLFHTKTGAVLQSRHVTGCLQSYFAESQPHLSNVTTMTLRSSYCTYMMELYRFKRIFSDKTEHQFLDVLARIMNTSTEQLVTTYVGIDRTEFEDTAKELAKALDALSIQPKGLGGNTLNGTTVENADTQEVAGGRDSDNSARAANIEDLCARLF